MFVEKFQVPREQNEDKGLMLKCVRLEVRVTTDMSEDEYQRTMCPAQKN